MDEQPLISVIVPIYRVENYLDCCIESIVNQTYQNLEIILVDDGSPDRCPEICDEWEKKDNRINAVHIINGGAGNARNVGYSYSNGEWIAFIDSDDYLDNHMFEHLLSLVDDDCDLAECQIVISDSYDTDVFTDLVNENPIVMRVDVVEALRYHIRDNIFRQTPPNKIYRRKVVEGVKFPVGKLIDDEYWTYQVIGNCRELVHSSAKLYAYRQQEASAMHQKFSLKRIQALEANGLRIDYLEEKYPSIVSEAKISLWMSALYLGQLSLKAFNKSEADKAFQLIKDTLIQYPIFVEDISKLNKKRKLWIRLERISIKSTCRLRNILRIGL